MGWILCVCVHSVNTCVSPCAVRGFAQGKEVVIWEAASKTIKSSGNTFHQVG